MLDSDLIIQGGAFTDQTTLNGLLAKRMNIVFGRNGSGKSTIARAFREQQADRLQLAAKREYSLSVDGSGNLPSEIQDRLFVFNEDFIDSNVKLAEKGLKSIVRIGAAAEQDSRIQELTAELVVLKNDLELIKGELVVLDGKGSGSVSEADKKLRDGLKTQGGYIDRLSRVDKVRNLTSALLDPILDPFAHVSSSYSIKASTDALERNIDRYLSFQEGGPVSWVKPVVQVGFDLDHINSLLSISVRPAELDDNERAILADLSDALADEDFISKSFNLIVKDRRGYCPLCHQPVSEEHRQSLEKSLIRFRGKGVEDHKEDIRKASAGVTQIYFRLPELTADEYGKDLDAAQEAINRFNAFVSEVLVALDRKMANPLAALPAFDGDELERLTSDCQAALDKVADDLTAYNTSLQEKETLLTQIKKDNATLAIHENLHWREEYIARRARRDDLASEELKIKNNISEQVNAINSLKGKMEQIEEAREQINGYLHVIFGDKRLKLVLDGKDTYKLQLKSGDSYVDIPPRSISSGERNALALAYFFACVLEKKDKNYHYGDPTLLVIDDPVSSFDAENKAGVLSLIMDQCRKVLDGNPESKVLVLTHDYATLRDLCEWRKNNNLADDKSDKFLKLGRNHKLVGSYVNTINEAMEYYGQLSEIFSFANAAVPEEFDGFDTMGNTIRRFTESYARRMYRCNWNELFTKDSFLQRVPIECRERVKSFAIRNVLNSGSHSVLDIFEPSEVQRSARVVLAFMLWANYEHLYAYLVPKSGNDWRMKEVERWAKEL